MIRADWNKDLIKELETFPYGRNDDQVDALSDAFHELTINKRKRFVAI
jgi:predicted phage terminase large subunit-like protein